MDKLINVTELSALLQVSKRTIYDWTHIGFVPHYKLPKGIRFKPSEIETWLKKRRVTGRPTYKKDISDRFPQN